METGIFAYLDILGFSSAVRLQEGVSALSLLEQINLVLQEKYVDGKLREKRNGKHTDPLVEKLNSNIEITAFKYFFCVSDSIFIFGTDVNLFVCQLANFVRACYSMGQMPEEPIVLLRGGISYGNVQLITLKRGIEGKLQNNWSIFGQPVVNAVEYEKKFGLKGPRLILDSEVYSKLNSEIRETYISKLKLNHNLTNEKVYYEILWPAFEFIKENLGIINEVGQMRELLTLAYKNFQNYLSAPNIVEHYNSLLELILRSAQQFFSINGHEKEFKNYIEEITKNVKPDLEVFNEIYWSLDFRNYLYKIYNERVLNQNS